MNFTSSYFDFEITAALAVAVAICIFAWKKPELWADVKVRRRIGIGIAGLLLASLIVTVLIALSGCTSRPMTAEEYLRDDAARNAKREQCSKLSVEEQFKDAGCVAAATAHSEINAKRTFKSDTYKKSPLESINGRGLAEYPEGKK